MSLAPDAEALEGELERLLGPSPKPPRIPPAPKATPEPDKSLPGYKESPY